MIENILDYLIIQAGSLKYINSWRPLLQVIDKIMQSGNVNSFNYVNLSQKIFSIADKIYMDCRDLISKLEINNPNYNIFLNEVFNQELEITKNKNHKYTNLPLANKVLFFW